MTKKPNCELFNQPHMKKEATIETAYGGKKIVSIKDTEETFLAFDIDELKCEQFMLKQIKENELFHNIPTCMKFWIEQRIHVINKFVLGDMKVD